MKAVLNQTLNNPIAYQQHCINVIIRNGEFNWLVIIIIGIQFVDKLVTIFYSCFHVVIGTISIHVLLRLRMYRIIEINENENNKICKVLTSSDRVISFTHYFEVNIIM